MLFQIASVCHEAAMLALQENIRTQQVDKRHFEQALVIVTPRINESLITFYEQFAKQTGLDSL